MSEPKNVYDSDFYAAQMHGSVRSATVVVPSILELFPDTKSVLDVGCGTGAWLSVFQRHGVDDVFGIDFGTPEPGSLFIESSLFQRTDLEQPFETQRRFDLCLCLELAEHLTKRRAQSLVSDLCKASDLVVFSAAIPGQNGTHHYNEAWLSSWAALFEENRYKAFDVLRPRLWNDDRVEYWYRQNIVVFANTTRSTLISRLNDVERHSILDIVHPSCFKTTRDWCETLQRENIQLQERLSISASAAQRKSWTSTFSRIFK